MNIAHRNTCLALMKHMDFCQKKLTEAETENAKWNGFYSQQYEKIMECNSKGLDYMQFDSLRRKAKAEVKFWHDEFAKAVHQFYGSFETEGHAILFLLLNDVTETEVS